MYSLSSVADQVRFDSSITALREPTFRLADRMQKLPPHLQFNALALAFVVASEALGLDPHEEITRARNKIADAEGPFTTQVQALRDYVAGELRRDPK